MADFMWLTVNMLLFKKYCTKLNETTSILRRFKIINYNFNAKSVKFIMADLIL